MKCSILNRVQLSRNLTLTGGQILQADFNETLVDKLQDKNDEYWMDNEFDSQQPYLQFYGAQIMG